MVTATILVDTNGERESTFRVLSETCRRILIGRLREYVSSAIVTRLVTAHEWLERERESTFRELSFDLLTGLDNKFRVEVKLIFEVLPTTEPFVPFFSLKESQHVKV